MSSKWWWVKMIINPYFVATEKLSWPRPPGQNAEGAASDTVTVAQRESLLGPFRKGEFVHVLATSALWLASLLHSHHATWLRHAVKFHHPTNPPLSLQGEHVTRGPAWTQIQPNLDFNEKWNWPHHLPSDQANLRPGSAKPGSTEALRHQRRSESDADLNWEAAVHQSALKWATFIADGGVERQAPSAAPRDPPGRPRSRVMPASEPVSGHFSRAPTAAYPTPSFTPTRPYETQQDLGHDMTRDTQYDRTRRSIISTGGAEASSQVEQEVLSLPFDDFLLLNSHVFFPVRNGERLLTFCCYVPLGEGLQQADGGSSPPPHGLQQHAPPSPRPPGPQAPPVPPGA